MLLLPPPLLLLLLLLLRCHLMSGALARMHP
jgi:hypothetical protein